MDIKLVSIIYRFNAKKYRETAFRIGWLNYNKKTYSCNREYKMISRTDLIKAVKNKDIILMNGKITTDNKVVWNVPEDKSKRIKMVVSKVRELMECKYGTDTDLCGRCIEASELIVSNLKLWGIEQCKTVEGWCKFDDASGCSDRPYDPHTWVEMKGGYYIDVTADQFNLFMDNPYDSILIRKGLPYGIVYEEPVEMLDSEDWYR